MPLPLTRWDYRCVLHLAKAVCVYMWVYMCAHACGGQRSTLKSFSHPPSYCWRQGSLTKPGVHSMDLMSYAHLSCARIMDTQCHDQLSTWVLGSSVLMLSQQSLLSLNLYILEVL